MNRLNFFGKLMAISLIAAGTLVSCEDEVNNTDLLRDDFNTASLKVYLYADLDLTTAGQEAVPQGTKVVISLPNNSFNSGATGTWSDTLEVGAEGFVESQLKVPSKGGNFTVQPLVFEAEQKQGVTSKETEIKKIFEAPSISSGNLLPNSNAIKQGTYAASNYSNKVEFVDVELYFNGDFIATSDSPADDRLPSGVSIVLYTNGWTSTVSDFVEASKGSTLYSKATVSVPKGQAINMVDIEYKRTEDDPSGTGTISKPFIYSLPYSLMVNTDGTKKEITLNATKNDFTTNN